MKKIILYIVFLLLGFEGWGQEFCGATMPTIENKKFLIDLFSKNKNSKIQLNQIYLPIKIHIGTNKNIESLKGQIFEAIFKLNKNYINSKVQFYIDTEIQILDFTSKNVQLEADLLSFSQTVGFTTNAINLFCIDKLDPDNKIEGKGIFPFNSAAANLVIIDNDIVNSSATLFHEFGHYFNLFHTHHNNLGYLENDTEMTNTQLCNSGDFIPDTPFDPWGYNQPNSLSGVDVNPNFINNSFSVQNCIYQGSNLTTNCGQQFSSLSPDLNNFMSYYHIAVYGCELNHFTDGQNSAINATAQSRLGHTSYNIDGYQGLAKVENFQVLKQTGKSFLAWSPVLNSNGYIIERSAQSNFIYTSVLGFTSQTTFEDTPPNTASIFYYRVRSINSKEYSDIKSNASVSYTPGITVLTHGFSTFGNLDSDWLENAQAIRNRVSTELGASKGATILVNNKASSQWTIKNLNGGNGIANLNEELIFVYDWGVASNNNNTGYLEAAADNLFAMLANPVIRFSNGNTLNLNTQAGNLITNKKTHFIGHSRGTILMLQLLHRLQKHLPNATIDRLTLLDPHPAGVMGDVKRQNIPNSPENLPGVFGYADNCNDGIIASLCDLGNQIITLKIPNNVVRAESFFRQDALYEPAGSLDLPFPFSGINVLGIGSNSYFMNNSALSYLEGIGGNLMDTPHTNVHKWYFGTVDLNIVPPSMIPNQPNNWYTTEVGNFMVNQNRLTIGYNKEPSLPFEVLNINQMNNQLNSRTGKTTGLGNIIGGDFNFNSKAGWLYNNLDWEGPRVINNELSMHPTLAKWAAHNIMYFPSDLHSISLDLKIDLGSYTGQTMPLLIVEFYNANGVKIKQVYKSTLSTTFTRVHFGLPQELLGKNGTFRLLFGDNGALNDYSAANLNMIIDNIELSNETLVVPAPTITVSQTTILGGQSISLTATGCETGIVHWTTGQTGQTVNYTPIQTAGYAAYCEIDGFYSTPSNAIAVTVNYNQNLSSSEYFFDTDPGYGAGHSLGITGTPAVIDQTFNIALASHNLSQGVHTFNVRVKDSQNQWSLTHARTFLLLGAAANGVNEIVNVEYFVDGLLADNSNMVSLNIVPDGDLIAVDLPINLPQGVHTVSYRVKDGEGKYSLFHTRTFLVLGSNTGNGAISQVEYFMDTDPGFGNGTAVNFTGSNTTPMVMDLNLAGLSQGVHVVYVRVKTNQGRWSLTHARAFVILENNTTNSTVSKIEYFFDTDPGPGNGTNVSFTNNAEGGVTADLNINIGAMPAGVHYLYARAQNSEGYWSPIRNAGFDVTHTTNCVISITSGIWGVANTWSCNRSPNTSDEVTILSNHTVTVPTGTHYVNKLYNFGNLVFEPGGILIITGN